MKRIWAMGMVMLLLLSMAGCGKSEEKSASAQAAAVVHSDAPEDEVIIVENQDEPQEQSEEKESETKAPAKKDTPKKETSKKEVITPDSDGEEIDEVLQQEAEQILEQVTLPQEEAPSEQESPIEQESPLLQRNTEMEQKLVGKWSETVDVAKDLSQAMAQTMGLELTIAESEMTATYTFKDGKITTTLEEESFKRVLKNWLIAYYTKLAETQGMTLEQAGITEGMIDLAVASYMLSASLNTEMEYAIYDENVLWYGGIRVGEIVELTETRCVIQEDDGTQTIMTRI